MALTGEEKQPDQETRNTTNKQLLKDPELARISMCHRYGDNESQINLRMLGSEGPGVAGSVNGKASDRIVDKMMLL